MSCYSAPAQAFGILRLPFDDTLTVDTLGYNDNSFVYKLLPTLCPLGGETLTHKVYPYDTFGDSLCDAKR